jgi:hypothetical protein
MQESPKTSHTLLLTEIINMDTKSAAVALMVLYISNEACIKDGILALGRLTTKQRRKIVKAINLIASIFSDSTFKNSQNTIGSLSTKFNIQ